MSLRSELILDFKKSQGTISPMIYGHFSEHIGGVFYDGLWVGEDSPVENIRGFRKALVDSFKKINPSILRWPGGCFAETYDWHDGIGPREKRPVRLSWWTSYDGRYESNAVGTHEFMDFCDMVGARPYVAANITSLTPKDIRDWIEYCNLPANTTTWAKLRGENGSTEPFNVEYWGIGNENWGGGGRMTPEMYTREYIRYATVCHEVDKKNTRFIICGANGHDVSWTRRVMQEWAKGPGGKGITWGMAIHYYCGTAGAPQTFTEAEWYQQLFQADFMRRIIEDHRAAMDEFDPDRKMAMVIDEWGCWHKDGSGPSKGYNLFEQQSSMRDAIVAAMTLNLFNNRCDVVKMANIAQLCNNLHSLYLAGGEHFVETPNYHVYDMYKAHQGARHIATTVHCDTMEHEKFRPMELLSASASEKDGKLTVTLANLSMTETQEIKLVPIGGVIPEKCQVTVLTHEDVHACNTFENPETVVPETSEVLLKDGVLTIPPASVVMLTA